MNRQHLFRFALVLWVVNMALIVLVDPFHKWTHSSLDIYLSVNFLIMFSLLFLHRKITKREIAELKARFLMNQSEPNHQGKPN